MFLLSMFLLRYSRLVSTNGNVHVPKKKYMQIDRIGKEKYRMFVLVFSHIVTFLLQMGKNDLGLILLNLLPLAL